MLDMLLPLALAGWVLVALLRAAGAAWRERALALAVWRSVRPRHVVGGLGLLAVVLGVIVLATAAVPALGRGLGDLVGTTGNAVFAPVDAAVVATGPTVGDGSTRGDVVFAVLVSAFLGGLVLLLPWLAFVEEEVFRAGSERWSPARRLVTAVVFGAAHLVMLVPLAAALGIAVAGLAYDLAYRRAHPSGPAPAAAARAFRPTRRSERAVDEAVAAATGGPTRATAPRPATSDDPPTPPGGIELAVRATPARGQLRDRQVAGVFAATVWHTTTNTLVVLCVWAVLLLEALGG